MIAPAAGAVAKTIAPPAPAVQPEAASPSTLTRIVSGRGRVMRRNCGSSPSP